MHPGIIIAIAAAALLLVAVAIAVRSNRREVRIRKMTSLQEEFSVYTSTADTNCFVGQLSELGSEALTPSPIDVSYLSYVRRPVSVSLPQRKPALEIVIKPCSFSGITDSKTLTV